MFFPDYSLKSHGILFLPYHYIFPKSFLVGSQMPYLQKNVYKGTDFCGLIATGFVMDGQRKLVCDDFQKSGNFFPYEW